MSEFNTPLYRKLALQQALLTELTDQDELEDLSDIEYLKKLSKRNSLVSQELAKKNLIPSDPLNEMEIDAKRVAKLLEVFASGAINKIISEIKLSNQLKKKKKGVTKTLINSQLARNESIKSSLSNTIHKAAKLIDERDWVNGSLCPYIKSFAPELSRDMSSMLLQFVDDRKLFEKKLDEEIIEVDSNLKRLLKAWGEAENSLNEVNELFASGQIDQAKEKLSNIEKFSDLGISERNILTLFDEKIQEKKEIEAEIEDKNNKLPKGKLRRFVEKIDELPSGLSNLLQIEVLQRKYDDELSKRENKKAKEEKQKRNAKFFIFLIAFGILAIGIFISKRSSSKNAESKKDQLREEIRGRIGNIEEYLDNDTVVSSPSKDVDYEKLTKVTSKFANGLPSTVYHTLNGKMEGKAIIFYESGGKQLESEYRNGQLHGTRFKYSKSGKIISKIEYNNGKIVKLKNY